MRFPGSFITAGQGLFRAVARSDERAARLYRLLQLLARGSQSRDTLTRQLGTDVRVIQMLLGHRSIRTTVRYTRVTNRLVTGTKSRPT